MLWILRKTAGLSVRKRVYALILIIVCGTFMTFGLGAHYISTSLYEARYEQTRRLVETTHSLLGAILEEGKEEGIEESQIKSRALHYVQKLRYDHKEYYWIHDRNGFLVQHPYPSLNNREAINLQDGRGTYIIKDMLKLVAEKGEGRYSYYWPPTEASQLKVSYIKEFKPWGWTIGSGVYINDIQQTVGLAQKHLAISIGVLALVAFAMAFYVGASISSPLQSLTRLMQNLAGGDLGVTIPTTTGPREIQTMAQTVQVFLENARRISLLENEQKESESLQTEFVSVVSHELRTPLTSIRGSLGLLSTGKAGNLPDKAQKLVFIAYSNCERLILLINDILDIDKISAGNMRYHRTAESLNNMISAVIDSNKAFAEKYFVRLDFTPLPIDQQIYVDANRFQQVLTNFISNAAKFSPAGAKVDVMVTLSESKARITVRDYGIGIPDEFRSKIFRKFSQADSSTTRQKGGTGLGLYICKQIVEQMGGRIGYETKMGFGASFWVEFHLANVACPFQPQIEDGEKQSQNILSDVDLVGTSDPVLLHIEPDADFSRSFCEMLRENTKIIQTPTILAALDYLKRTDLTFAAIVMELNLSDIQQLPDLCQVGKSLNIPVFALTSQEATDEQRTMLDTVMIKAKASETYVLQTVNAAVLAARSKPQEKMS